MNNTETKYTHMIQIPRHLTFQYSGIKVERNNWVSSVRSFCEQAANPTTWQKYFSSGTSAPEWVINAHREVSAILDEIRPTMSEYVVRHYTEELEMQMLESIRTACAAIVDVLNRAGVPPTDNPTLCAYSKEVAQDTTVKFPETYGGTFVNDTP